MPGAGRAELYLIVGAMVVILMISFSAVFFFMKTYKKEKAERMNRETAKKLDEQTKAESEHSAAGN